MTDYGIHDRRKFLRQVRLLEALRTLYYGIAVLSVGVALGAVVNLFSKGTP